MASDNPMDQLANLMETLAEVAAGQGLKLEGFAAVPGNVGGPHLVQAIFALDPEVAFKSAEERDMEQQFREIAIRQRIESHEEQFDRIREEGLRRLEGIENLGTKDGIGLDEGPVAPPPAPHPSAPNAPTAQEPSPVAPEGPVDPEEMTVEQMLAAMEQLDKGDQ